MCKELRLLCENFADVAQLALINGLCRKEHIMEILPDTLKSSQVSQIFFFERVYMSLFGILCMAESRKSKEARDAT